MPRIMPLPDPAQFMEFVRQYRSFKEYTKKERKREGTLSREAAQPYMDRYAAAQRQTERRSLQHGQNTV